MVTVGFSYSFIGLVFFLCFSVGVFWEGGVSGECQLVSTSGEGGGGGSTCGCGGSVAGPLRLSAFVVVIVTRLGDCDHEPAWPCCARSSSLWPTCCGLVGPVPSLPVKIGDITAQFQPAAAVLLI